jgi:hypothetical protein
MGFLSSKAINVGWNIASNAASKVLFPFWKRGGIENTSRKVYDGSIPLQEQSDGEDESRDLFIPDGETIDPEVLSVGYPRLERLKDQGSGLTVSGRPMAGDLLVDTSSQTKYVSILTQRANQARSNMDEYLEKFLEKSEQNEKLSKQIKEESNKASDLKNKASAEECSANTWQAWGQYAATAGGIATGLTQFAQVFPQLVQALPWLATALPIGTPIGLVLGAVGASIITYSAYRKWQAAKLTCEGEKMQAEVQHKRDEQSKNTNDGNALQNLFSVASQSYNAFISMLQSVISALHEAKRTAAANIR